MKYFRAPLAWTLAAGLIVAPMAAPVAVEASSWAGNIIQGAAAMSYVRKQLVHLDNNAQDEVLEKTMNDVGYYDNPQYQQRAKRILQDLVNTGIPERDYVIFVNPDENINAFMTLSAVMSVNKGTMDVLDDDQLAFVLAHEISHGENRDIVNGATKKMGLSTAAQIFLNSSNAGAGTAVLMNIGTNFVKNEVFTMGQERKADELGFKILAASHYNLGGAPASMANLLSRSGDHYRDGIQRVIAPNTHPRTTSRVDDALERLTKYSGGKVTVRENTVVVNGRDVLTPVATASMTPDIRAYYVAGKLARLFHDKQTAPASLQGRQLVMSGVPLYTFSGNENDTAALLNLNEALAGKKEKKVEKKEVKQEEKKETKAAPEKKEEVKEKPKVKPVETKKDIKKDNKKDTDQNKSEGGIIERVQAILRGEK